MVWQRDKILRCETRMIVDIKVDMVSLNVFLSGFALHYRDADAGSWRGSFQMVLGIFHFYGFIRTDMEI